MEIEEKKERQEQKKYLNNNDWEFAKINVIS